MNTLPILGITMGDINGSGPEIAVQVMLEEQTYSICRPLLVGNADMVERAGRALKKELAIHRVAKVADAEFAFGVIDVYDLPLETGAEDPPYGVVTELGGRSAFEAVEKVIQLALAGEIDATITGPLNKESLNLAGYHYSGHTEIYAELTQVKDYAMMLADEALRVVHVSTHVSLRRACDLVKKERVLKVIQLANEACKDLGIAAPRIAVAGLNPHSGESGLFGTEEIEEINPAIAQAKALGLDVTGPVPPDTVFSKARGGMFDVVVVMYHDQGHIPLKVIGFVYNEEQKKWNSVSGVNITLGLPIIRVSVDHGTAFGKAGKGTASALSMENAIAYGAQMAKARRQKQ